MPHDDDSALSDLEHVRSRPPMYIGDTTLRGLHHLVYEIVDNSLEEASAGFAANVQVRLEKDGSVVVHDDGRGIPVERDDELSRKMGREFTSLEGLMTMLRYKSPRRTRYTTDGGLHGLGMTVVNYLSEWCKVEVHCGNEIHHQTYRRGEATGPVAVDGETSQTGTKTTFKPDGGIFQATDFDYQRIRLYLLEQAYLNSPVRISLYDARDDLNEEFHFERGVADFAACLAQHDGYAYAPASIVHAKGESNEVSYEIAVAYARPVISFANNTKTYEDGRHVAGFYSAFTAAITACAEEMGILNGLKVVKDDYASELAAVVSVRLPSPVFEGATKTRLANREAEEVVASNLQVVLEQHFRDHPYLVHHAIRSAEKRVGGH